MDVNEDVTYWLTLSIFALTYLGLAWGTIPGLRTDRSGIAWAGAALVFATTLLSFRQAVEAVGNEGATHRRPVVAGRLRVDVRRAAEFAPDDDRGVFQHAAKVEIFDQGAEALVELAAVVAGVVPPTVG
jgi:hypothetical protein